MDSPLINIMIKAAKKASRGLRRDFNELENLQVMTKGPADFVTASDIRTQNKGVTRSDFKFFNGKFYLLEINTQPGMTKLSLVPEIAKHKGISFIKLIEWILKDASINR